MRITPEWQVYVGGCYPPDDLRHPFNDVTHWECVQSCSGKIELHGLAHVVCFADRFDFTIPFSNALLRGPNMRSNPSHDQPNYLNTCIARAQESAATAKRFVIWMWCNNENPTHK